MIESEELDSLSVFSFENYGDNFYESDILIGNGFSINLCDRLNYKALHEIFLKFSSKELQEIFKAFGTSNFELIIDTLTKTQCVSDILKIKIDRIAELIIELRGGLIKSIEKTHPTYAETNMAVLRSLAAELSVFKNIYTTNYDVFLYKIILANNDLISLGRWESGLFQDAFYEDINPSHLGFGQIDYNKRQIYYLHGALFLFSTRSVNYKLRRIDSSHEFIDLLRMEVSNNNFPLFVSEGSSAAKKDAIGNNYYLRICGEALKRNKDKYLTTYGFSFSKPDKHIVDEINASSIKQILISIYPDCTRHDLEIELSRLRDLFGVIEVLFYDARTLFSFKNPKYLF